MFIAVRVGEHDVVRLRARTTPDPAGHSVGMVGAPVMTGRTMAVRRDALAARREALGFTQETLAQELGVELSTVGRWERGTLTPQPWRRPQLARLLQMPLYELDELLTPAPPPRAADLGASDQLASRRDVMVDGVFLTSAVVADRVVGTLDASLVGAASRPRSTPTVRSTSRMVAEVHRTYQAARYAEVGRLLPSVTGTVNTLVADGPAKVSREVLGLQCSLYVAAAKMATKAGDAVGAWTAAEKARGAAEAAEDTFGQAAATYQRTCALLRAGQRQVVEDAEREAVAAAENLCGADPQSVTWRGALTLISAIIAARRSDGVEATRRLDHADELAGVLGSDGNIGWTAFGPTNVLIHRLSVAVALNDPYSALATIEKIDITRLPTGLHGRQAQFYLDSAWAHAQLGEDPEAVIHLLDTERVAPELVRANPNARRLVQELLTRERRRAVPGLRGLAQRAGVAA